ncbi:sigma-54 dependent transcriptional regulator [Pendulispora rubella]|uniref:Sigma-54 dependent transcriptional regulator n=2 Tax=Pendulispora rubella TaxID=2741070 RepID=A0ABZ2KV35_9BACT
MRRLYPLCERLAGSNVPLIIEGETGTGKEVLAESLHDQGPRAREPFTVFDCTAVPPNLVEAALFGHERGAFTGATELRQGVFEQAHGGTLLIDEIGDLELELQAKLLRAIERSEVRRIGGKQWVRVDVRIIAATRRNLDEEVAAGRFRDDLFYRLAVARLELPPLRARTGDIRLLASHFWNRLAGSKVPIAEDFVAQLESYSWPGNVRELQNTVARRVVLGDLMGGEAIAPPSSRSLRSATPIEVTAPNPKPPSRSQSDPGDVIADVIACGLPLPRARERVLEAFERRYVKHLVDKHRGNVARAAAASGVALRYFQVLRARTKRREEET